MKRLVLIGLWFLLLFSASPIRGGDKRGVLNPSALIDQIEGVYKERFQNSLVDGSQYQSENILEVVRYRDDIVYFRTHLEFFNGHECNLYGMAQYKDGEFVYEDPSEDNPGERCVLRIRLGDKDVLLQDHNNSCKYYCGARGSFMDVKFSLKRRRKIRYLERLKKSSQYQESVQKLKPAK